MAFKDYFSEQAAEYTQYRPSYPAALFEYLASLVANRTSAWDCATGNGQAALGLTQFFERIIATDASETQIRNAIKHEKITYAVAPAEKTAIETSSLDLIVIAQALHWFDLDKFYTEARRVLRSGGVIAAWSYSLLRISPAVDNHIDKFYADIVGPFWPPERKLVDDRYRSIPFPFEEFSAPQLSMEATWSLEHVVGYLGTWSSVLKFREQHGTNPVDLIIKDLRQAWGRPGHEKRIRWPINMRVGKLA